MSMIELAYAAGVSKSHVHQIENGDRTRMRLTTLSKYARALGVPESYIDYGFGMARVDSQERQVDLTATLRRATQLEDHHIQQVLGLIEVLEAETSRCDLSREAAASGPSGSGAGRISWPQCRAGDSSENFNGRIQP